jgi:nucleotide-binding universal stress UspA family protein
MALDDILVHLDGYPDKTPADAIEQAVQFAVLFGGKATALACRVQISFHSNWLAEHLVGLSAWVAQEERRSLTQGREALAEFTERAKEAGVFQDAVLEHTDLYLVGEHLTGRARTRDLCIVSLDGSGQRGDVAQSVIFGSGRPVLVLGDCRPPSLNTVVLAWDGSRSAARAMGDAMPALARAGSVRVVTIVNEKAAATHGLGREVLRHLSAHGVKAVAEEIDAAGRPIGQVFEDYLEAHNADLLVMGAYGHSRLREFVLGGATEHMMRAIAAPVLVSH